MKATKTLALALLASPLASFAAVNLDFTTATSITGDVTDAGGRVFAGVFDDAGTKYDLAVTAVGPFTIGNPSAPTTLNDLALITQDGGTFSTLTFSVYETGTTTLATLSEFDITFADVDGQSSGDFESLIVYAGGTGYNYTLSGSTTLDVDDSVSGQTTFTNTTTSNPGAPTSTTSMSAAQEAVAVELTFFNTAEFSISYDLTDFGTGSRGILFDGAATFTTETTTTVPPVPEPSSFALLFGLAAIGFSQLRRRK